MNARELCRLLYIYTESLACPCIHDLTIIISSFCNVLRARAIHFDILVCGKMLRPSRWMRPHLVKNSMIFFLRCLKVFAYNSKLFANNSKIFANNSKSLYCFYWPGGMPASSSRENTKTHEKRFSDKNNIGQCSFSCHATPHVLQSVTN